jgi:transposase
VHYPRKLIELFTEAIHLRNRYLKGEVSAQELKEAKSRFDERLEKLARPAREVPAYEKLSEHLWKHLHEWFVFLEHPDEIEPTNWKGGRASDPSSCGQPQGVGRQPHLAWGTRSGSPDVRPGDLQTKRPFRP